MGNWCSNRTSRAWVVRRRHYRRRDSRDTLPVVYSPPARPRSPEETLFWRHQTKSSRRVVGFCPPSTVAITPRCLEAVFNSFLYPTRCLLHWMNSPLPCSETTSAASYSVICSGRVMTSQGAIYLRIMDRKSQKFSAIPRTPGRPPPL